MADNINPTPKRTFSILDQDLVVPSLGLLAGMTAAFAGTLLLIGLLGGPVSIFSFVFGCGIMWLIMAGLDLRRAKAWAVVLAWVLIVFGLNMIAGALLA